MFMGGPNRYSFCQYLRADQADISFKPFGSTETNSAKVKILYLRPLSWRCVEGPVGTVQRLKELYAAQSRRRHA